MRQRFDFKMQSAVFLVCCLFIYSCFAQDNANTSIADVSLPSCWPDCLELSSDMFNYTSDATDASLWRSDEASILFEGVEGIRPWNMSVIAEANGEFFVEEEGGHFRVAFTVETEQTGWLSGTTEPIELSSSASRVRAMLEGAMLINAAEDSYQLSSIMSINVKKFGNGKVESGFKTIFEITMDSAVANSLSAELDFAYCSPLRTVGYWDDAANWADGVVPNETSRVVFPPNSGVAVMTTDVTLAGLDMWGGYIIAQTSGCVDGWSPFMSGNDGCVVLYIALVLVCPVNALFYLLRAGTSASNSSPKAQHSKIVFYNVRAPNVAHSMPNLCRLNLTRKDRLCYICAEARGTFCLSPC